MTAKEKWNIVVSQYLEHYSESEKELQKVWERIFVELFGYSSFCGEVDSQRSIKIGSKERVVPDIILKRDGIDLVDVELKLSFAPFDSQMESQMISYLKLLNLSIGVLVCKKLYLYIFDYANSKTQKVSIDFTKDNPDGVRFVELLQKSTFSKESIKDFVQTKNVFSENVGLIRDELSSAFLKQLVIKHFEESFARDEIDAALSGYSFDCKAEKQVAVQTATKTKNVHINNNVYVPKVVSSEQTIDEVEKIRNVIASLGGEAKFSDIYNKYFEMYGCHGKDNEASIRGTIYANTSDSMQWGKNSSSGNDVFYKAGKGRWGNR